MIPREPPHVRQHREAVAAGQLNVEQHQVGGWSLGDERGHQRLARGQADHPVALHGEQCRDELQVVGLVFHYHDRGHQARGTVNQKVLPLPSWLSTPMAPPWSSTRRFDSARPRPVPS